MRLDKKDIFVYCLFFAITLVFFFRFLDGREVFAFKDLSRYFYPIRQLMVEQVKLGAWPLWNPYIFFGMPLMAGLQPGLFYPLTLIYYLIPFDLAFNYYIIIHYFLAACFMFCFMRHLKASYFASFFSGLIFSFSGYLLSVSNMNTSMSSVIWLPLVLLFFDKFLKFKGRYFLGLILCLALMFLGGEPTIIYVTGIVLFFWALVFVEDKREKIRAVFILAAALLIMACLIAVQLLPFFELSALSNRMTTTQYNIVSLRSFPIREVVGFFMPFFYGNQLRGGSYSPILVGKTNQDWLISPYLGIIPLIFALFSFFYKKDNKIIWFFMVSAAVSLLTAFGRYTPLYYIMYKVIPGLSLIRYPVKYLFLTTFSFSVLAGFGYDRATKNIKRGALIFAVFFIISALIYLLVNAFQIKIFLLLKAHYPKLHPFFINVLWANLQFNIQSLFYLALMIFFCAVLFYIRMKGLVRNYAFGLIIAGMVFFDLLANNSALNTPSDPRVYHELTPNVKLLMKEAGISRYYYSKEVEQHNRSVYGEDYDQSLLDAQDKLAAARLMSYKLYDAYGYESIELQEHAEFHSRFFDKKSFKYRSIINMINAKYLADLAPIKLPGLKLKRKNKYYYGTLYLYENLNVLPRAYIVGSYGLAKRKDVLSALADKKFNPKNFIVLEEDPKIKGGQRYLEAKIIKYSPDEIIIKAELDKPGFLFLSDTYYPGWRACVDGREAKIYRANFMFRAVVLEKGRHEVRFVYDPLFFKAGMIISIVALLGLALTGWRLRCKANIE